MNGLNIQARVVDGVGVIYPGPYLNQLRGEAVENRCQQLLAQGVRSIVINFAETELINSIGISILLGVLEAVRDARGALVLSNLSESNHELFEMLGLLAHVRTAVTEENALDQLCMKVELTAG